MVNMCFSQRNVHFCVGSNRIECRFSADFAFPLRYTCMESSHTNLLKVHSRIDLVMHSSSHEARELRTEIGRNRLVDMKVLWEYWQVI
jgi:hypothetical protein